MSGPHDVEMDYNTKLSQRKDPIEEFKDAVEEFEDAPDQSRPIPFNGLEDGRQSVYETRSDSPKISTLEPERKASGVEGSVKANEMLIASQNECEMLRTQVFELQKNLQDAQDFIFTLQPRRQKLTETEAAADFNTLCGSIEELVDTKLGEALDDMILTKENSIYLQPSEKLLSLIPSPGKEAFKYQETDKYNITAAILRFLCQEIFNQEFYCSAGSRELKFIVSVERSMRNLEPGRDLITCRTWRSETYTAIANLPQFSQLCDRKKEALTTELTAMLRVFIPRTDKRGFHTAVRNTIIEPAFTLAHKMHLSVDYFSIKWSEYNDLRYDQRNSLTGKFNYFELVDLLASGKKLKTAPSGTINYILDITPQLVFQMVKANSCEEPKVLKKPKILVALTKEGHGHFREQAIRPERNATVLGWLHTAVHIVKGQIRERRRDSADEDKQQ